LKRSALILLLAVVAIRLWLAADNAFPGDGWAAGYVSERGAYHEGLPALIIKGFTKLGSPKGAFLVVLVAALVAWRLAGGLAALTIVAAIGAVVLNDVIKVISGPTDAFTVALGHRPHEYDFPSGHTAYAAAVFGAIGVVSARRRFWPGVALAAAVIVGMGPARVVGGFHLVSDVVAGYAVGAAWLLLVMAAAGAASRARGGTRTPGRAAAPRSP
jgi:membrane-associated phospholipid phosphatase